jgi:hypothetical protein
MNYALGLGAPTWIPFNGALLFLLILWSIFWKGLALWHSGQRGQAWWFVIILVVNTAGILEIIYLFAILKLSFSRLFSRLH